MNKISGDIPIVKAFVYNGGYYMYDTCKNQLLSVTREHYIEIVELLRIGMTKYKALNKRTKIYTDILMLINKGYFNSIFAEAIIHPESDYISSVLDRGINDITLQVTRDCNFNCRYCLYAAKSKLERTHEQVNMQWDVAQKSLDYLITHSKDVDKITVAFYGGEPLLNFNLIKSSIDYMNEKLNTKSIVYNMTINGSILYDDILDYLVSKNVFLTISLDGPEEIQNRHRKFSKNGKPTFRVVVDNVIKIKKKYPSYFESNVKFIPVGFGDEKYEEIIEMAKKLEILKPDGIIAADGGVIEILKQYAPDVKINVSTQANIVSLHSANFWYKNGARRMIMAREMNKEQLKYIMANKPKDMEIEIFIHGAICFAFSGRCFLSDFLACRSANLGDCAQSCRWSYNLYAEEKNHPGEYMPLETSEYGTSIFSSKDLCLIKEIPEIIDMGIDSLKIEGRLKTEYYLASVINAYRNAIDDYEKDPEHYDYTKYLKELEKVKTRGLTTFYFNDRKNKDIQEYSGRQYNEKYEFGAKVVDGESEISTVEIRNKLSVGDTLEIIEPNKIEPIEFKIEKLYDVETNEEIDSVSPGVKGQQVKIKLPIKCKKDWIIRRKK